MRSCFSQLAAIAGECERSQESFRCLNTFITQKMKMLIIISLSFFSLSHTHRSNAVGEKFPQRYEMKVVRLY